MLERRSWQMVLRRSEVHGQGLFSEEAIPEGVAVVECRGIVLPRAEVPDGARAMQIGPDTYLVEDPRRAGIDDFLNHSCDPNLGFLTGSLELYSLRPIAPDEELCFDYGTCMNEPAWWFDCSCRAPACRGVVRSFCELPPREKRRLRRIALEYLR